MPFRYSPHNMYRPSPPILLEDQHAGAFRIVRIILYNNGFSNSLNNIPNVEIIR